MSQLESLLGALRKGQSLASAALVAGLPVDDLQRAIESSADLAELVADAMSYGAQNFNGETALPTDEELHRAEAVTRDTAEQEQSEDEPDAEAGDDEDEEPEDPLRRELIEPQAREFGPGMCGYLLWLDEQLAAQRFGRISDWWRYTYRSFYESGKRWLLVRAGRGGGKSRTLTRAAAAEGMFAVRSVPPGERWIWPFISVGTDDTKRRIVEIQAILRAIGRDTELKMQNSRPLLEVNDIDGQAIAFVGMASTIAGVSGPSAIGATMDEEAKLRDRSSNANPATEILISLLQTFRARENCRGIRCSSAWKKDGSHYQSIEDGDSSSNHIARIGEPFLDVVLDGLSEVAIYEQQSGNAKGAARIREYMSKLDATSPNVPTWLANPTITAIRSRLEVNALPDKALDGLDRVDFWLRENASVTPNNQGACVMSANEIEILRDANRRISNVNTSSSLIMFDGLGGEDPRSTSYTGGRTGGTL